MPEAIPSRINPAISAYTQVKGTFDFNKTPLAPAGCKVIVHNRRMERSSWADRGTDGFFIDQSPQQSENAKNSPTNPLQPLSSQSEN
jgi:hypothetical protein